MKLHRIDIKALTWKRTGGSGNRRFMLDSERKYYGQLENKLRKLYKPFGKNVELNIYLEFHFLTKHWRDVDNLEKGIYDAGQPSKWWLPRTQRSLVTDLWDDKVFKKVNKERFRRSDGDYIIIGIEEA